MVSRGIAAGGKLRVISRLIKAWGFANALLVGISGLYVDMLLATSADVSVGQSYGECLLDFFRTLIERELRSLRNPTASRAVSSRVHRAARLIVFTQQQRPPMRRLNQP
jgi:hypothetical protein